MPLKVVPRFLPETRASNIVRALLNRSQSVGANASEQLRGQLRDICRVDGVLLMPSARAGLYWILRALDPPRLYLPAFLCSSIYECALRAGTPMTYLDVVPGSFDVRLDNVDFQPGSVLLIVHQYGIPSDVVRAKRIADEKGLILIEDNAPSLGATWGGKPVGGFGHASIVSFEYSKVISACKGGAALFQDPNLYDACKRTIQMARANGELGPATPWLRDALVGLVYDILLNPLIYGTITLPLFRMRHGPFVDRSQTIERGGAYQADFAEGRACLALDMLARLPEIARGRRAVARSYEEILSGTEGIELTVPDKRAEPVYSHYPVLVPQGARDRIVRNLWAAGVDPGFNFSYLCGGHDAERSAPISKEYTERIITLPISSRIGEKQATAIALTLKRAVDATLP